MDKNIIVRFVFFFKLANASCDINKERLHFRGTCLTLTPRLAHFRIIQDHII